MVFPVIILQKKPRVNRFSVRSYCRGLLLLLWAANVNLAWSEDVIDLNRAIELTLTQHPELSEFAHRADAVAGYVQQAGVGSRVQLEARVEDGFGTGSHSGFSMIQSSVVISWLLDAQQVESRVREASDKAGVLVFEKEAKALDLAAATARLFVRQRILLERMKLARLARDQGQQALKAISARVAAGKSSLVDQHLAQAELSRRNLDLEDLHHELEASLYQLVAQWRGDAAHYQVARFPLVAPNIGDFEQQKQKLLAHPGLKLFASKARLMSSQIARAKAEAEPQWQVSTGVRRYEASDDFGLIAGVSIPLGGEQRNAGTIKAITAKQGQNEAEKQALMLSLETQIFVLLKQLEHNQHVITQLSQQLLPLLEKALSEAKKAYAIGKFSYYDWTRVQQSLFSAQGELLDAYENAYLNQIELERLTGASFAN